MNNQVRLLILIVALVAGSIWAVVTKPIRKGLDIQGALCLVDRLAGGADAIADAAGAPFQALVTIDEIYPDRPDRS